MITSDPIKDKIYRIRLTDGSWTDVKFLYVHTTNHLRSRNVRHFMFENIRTGRMIEIKSRQRISECMLPATVQSHNINVAIGRMGLELLNS